MEWKSGERHETEPLMSPEIHSLGNLFLQQSYKLHKSLLHTNLKSEGGPGGYLIGGVQSGGFLAHNSVEVA